MTITRIHGSGIATLWLQTLSLSLSDYASLSDDSDFSRRISQIAPDEIPISSGEKQKYPPRYLKTHRERCPLPEKSTQLGRYY